MPIAYSGGKIIKSVLPKNLYNFLNTVCDTLLRCGWKEVKIIPPFASIRTNTAQATDGSNFFQVTQYLPEVYWKSSPSGPYQVAPGGPYSGWVNMCERLLSLGFIENYRSALDEKNSFYGNIYNTRMRIKLTDNDVFKFTKSAEPDTRFTLVYRIAYDSYTEWYRPGNWWSLGYKVFDSQTTQQGLKIRVWVGWQVGSSATEVFPCIKVTSYDEVLDPFVSYNENQAEWWKVYPIWNPCVSSIDSVDYEMICGPYWFTIYAKEIANNPRRFLYCGIPRLFDNMVPIRARITPGVTTTVHYEQPHNKLVGENISLTGIDPLDNGPVITSKDFQVVEVVNQTTLRIDVNTNGYSYTQGYAGDYYHPVNAACIISNDVTSSCGIRTWFYDNSYGKKGEAYFWNSNAFCSLGTGTYSYYDSSIASLWIPQRPTKRWFGEKFYIYEPYLGWGDSLRSEQNLIRGMAYDAVYIGGNFGIDSEILNKSLDGNNWHQLTNSGVNGSFHVLIP